MQDLGSKKQDPVVNSKNLASVSHQQKTQVSSTNATGAKFGERKNSLGNGSSTSSQQIMGEISNTHTVGRSIGVRGSVEIKSISTVSGLTNSQ
jgi:hypothetical protein